MRKDMNPVKTTYILDDTEHVFYC